MIVFVKRKYHPGIHVYKYICMYVRMYNCMHASVFVFSCTQQIRASEIRESVMAKREYRMGVIEYLSMPQVILKIKKVTVFSSLRNTTDLRR